VVSFRGVGRFVLGLYEDIRVLGGEEFVQYVRGKVAAMCRGGSVAEGR